MIVDTPLVLKVVIIVAVVVVVMKGTVDLDRTISPFLFGGRCWRRGSRSWGSLVWQSDIPLRLVIVNNVVVVVVPIATHRSFPTSDSNHDRMGCRHASWSAVSRATM